ncbi:hypothetical protein CLV63_101538 [Murinocardiopsis flavida]|uniref:Uncharacterized protein n=1 Tax=Murinocardiopsis flavida TaxID=645275 RepID=A0A2P8DUZ9_9ACTN|nr:hypothetical protein [Murinocardiopsis flavida]PSL01059.1 hypothetical protein CLV63_101538 [Murinocardiopsis flavida]
MHAPQFGPPGGPGPDIRIRLLGEPFHAAAPFLRVLVLPNSAGLGPSPLAYSISKELSAVLCYRPNPHTYDAVVLDAAFTQVWGLSKQDLWFTALANMRYESFEPQVFQTTADTEVTVVHGMTWPGTAHVMRLVDLIHGPAPFGAVVMLPNSNTMMFAVLRSKRSLPIIPFIFQTFQSLAADAPPLTDHLIWWRDGSVRAMGTRVGQGGSVEIAQSTEFSFLLDHELPD